jgi:hypothetical protein
MTLVQMMLKGVDFARQQLEFGEWNQTDFAVFQRHRVAGVVFGADAVHAKDLAGHLKAGDLVATVFGQYVGLEEARADGEYRFEGIAGAIQMMTALDLPPATDQAVEPRHVVVVEAEGQAQFAQVALGTGDLKPWGNQGYHVLLDVGMHGIYWPR